jgi:subtilisin family serine protease
VINKLRRQGIKFVASAGNARSHQKTIPACLDNVVSVGAGISAKDREWYSNYGPWVRQWRTGAVVSLMPLAERPVNASHTPDANGFALWSGTSFSAAILAGELAQEKAEERKASGGS